MARLTAQEAASRVFDEIGNHAVRHFRSSLDGRGLIYPTAYTTLTPGQYAGLATAASAVGDREAVIAPYGGSVSGWAETYDRRTVDLREYDSYVPVKDGRRDLVLEHLLFSPRGRWGCVTTHIEVAFFAGSDEFAEALRGALARDEESDAVSYLRDNWETMSYGRPGVLREELVHLYGVQRADDLIERALHRPR